MLTDLLPLTIGEERARDLLAVLAVPEELDVPTTGAFPKAVPKAVIAGALHFLLFEELLKRAPTALHVAADALKSGQKLRLDHAAMATLDTPFTGALPRGRHCLGQILEPLGYVQMEAHEVAGQNATAHIYRFNAMPQAVPDFVVMEVHAQRYHTGFQEAAVRVFGESPSPNHVRVQALVRKLQKDEDVTLAEAAELLQGMFVWFGRQHVPPLKDDYEVLLKESDMTAWMAHEGQGLSHITLAVKHLSAVMDVQMREDRALEPAKLSEKLRAKLVALVPDMGERAFRDASGRVLQTNVPIANLAFIERAEGSDFAPRFDPALFESI